MIRFNNQIKFKLTLNNFKIFIHQRWGRELYWIEAVTFI